MIANRSDLKNYLKADKEALGFTKALPSLIGNEIWKFQISLRYYEYYINTNKILFRLLWKIIYHHYSIKLGFDIPPNTCGKGLNIHHHGCIVINGNARIGNYCNIQQCVNIGQNYTSDQVPTIGDNVYIGPGAKLFGKINIADGCAIGAGSVVTKSFNEKNRTIAGNPARDIGARKNGLK